MQIETILTELMTSSIPGFVLAVLIPLLFLIFMIKNRRSRIILLYFCWGLLAVLFAYILNEWFSADANVSKSVTTDIAPIVEETLKALPLLLFFRAEEDRSNMIVYCGMASGIGFSVQETLYYFTSLGSAHAVSALLPLLVRSFTTCLMHGMSTAAVGFGIAATSRFKGLRLPMVLGLLSLAATFHSLYNTLITTRLAIIALFMPAVLYFLGLMLLRNEEETDGGGENGLGA